MKTNQPIAPTKPLPELIKGADSARMTQYTHNLDFYKGKQHDARITRRMPRAIVFNYAKTVIEKITSYVMADLNWAVDAMRETKTDESQARKAEALLYEIADANNLPALDLDNEIDTSVLGDGCYKVTWDNKAKRVRITAPDVQGIYIWTRGDDVTEVTSLASRYQISAAEAWALYKHRGGDPVTIVEGWTPKRFELWADHNLIWNRPNPYGFIPFIVYPNLREPKTPWGVSDLAPIIDPAKELNRALSTLGSILELSGNPITVLENVDEAEDIAVTPGSVWAIPADAKAYLLDLLSGGGVGLHIEYINLIFRTLHDLTEAPRTAFGDNQKALSGVALEMELHPLLQKVRRKRLIRTQVFRKRAAMCFALMNRYAGWTDLEVRVDPIWGPVLPTDRSRTITDEVKLVNAGIHSRSLAADTLGVADPEKQFIQWSKEQKTIEELKPKATAPQETPK